MKSSSESGECATVTVRVSVAAIIDYSIQCERGASINLNLPSGDLTPPTLRQRSDHSPKDIINRFGRGKNFGDVWVENNDRILLTRSRRKAVRPGLAVVKPIFPEHLGRSLSVIRGLRFLHSLGALFLSTVVR